MVYGLFIVGPIVFIAINLLTSFSEKSENILFATLTPSPITETPVQLDNDDGLWDGPVLYRKASNEPIHLILIEKDLQALHLCRYDGHYQLVKTYRCVTGKLRGDKQVENDEKTPEGIYFNVKTDIDDLDSAAIINKDITSHTSPTTGVTTISILPSDTKGQTPGNYVYDIRYDDGTGAISTILKGTFKITQAVGDLS